MLKLNLIVEHDANGYFAYCPELKGCVSQGTNYEEAYSNLKEAVELYLETLDSSEINALKNREFTIQTEEFAYV